MWLEQNVARFAPTLDALKKDLGGVNPEFCTRLVDAGKCYLRKRRDAAVVKPHHGDVLRNLQPLILGGAEQLDRCKIAPAEDSRRAVRRVKVSVKGCSPLVGVDRDTKHARTRRKSRRLHGLPISGLPLPGHMGVEAIGQAQHANVAVTSSGQVLDRELRTVYVISVYRIKTGLVRQVIADDDDRDCLREAADHVWEQWGNHYQAVHVVVDHRQRGLEPDPTLTSSQFQIGVQSQMLVVDQPWDQCSALFHSCDRNALRIAAQIVFK